MIEPTEEQIEAFQQGWEAENSVRGIYREPKHGDRTRAGLRAALNIPVPITRNGKPEEFFDYANYVVRIEILDRALQHKHGYRLAVDRVDDLGLVLRHMSDRLIETVEGDYGIQQ